MKTWESSLLAAQQAIGELAPDKENTYSKYKYVTAQKMVRTCKKALNDNGLLATLGDAGIAFDENGNMRVFAAFHLIHAETGVSKGYVYHMPLVSGKTPDDKVVLGIRTTLLRYWLRDLLMIPCDDNLDIDSRPDVPTKRPPRAKPQPETLGTVNARRLLDRMTDLGLDMGRLRAAIQAPDSSPDQWPRALGAKIKEWLDAHAQPAVANNPGT